MDDETRAKLQAKFGSLGARTGGRGTVRRKKKAVRKNGGQDDKRLQATLKKLNVNSIPAIEEVNMFKGDGRVIHFSNPKVQAQINANTFVVSGNAEEKPLADLLPGIYSQLGPQNVETLQHISNQYQARAAAAGGDGADDDDDVPDLVENFETAANTADDDVPELVEAPAQ
ncbi:Nascent polypeptide-associated complex subunit beta [Plasmodiophora brassicae]|uniref:Nascent polypeptide-associated complex subunit beta n=1 Tax=Plasmodiophora brassicae TaxID=37360 RepID=A0A0G4J6M8_PLABS|nr:hypothetical protein PBRA_002970 [Plasmodiophora brassicae]SPQ95453.1 unnamed protein product [Plasmodiophora brassicae]